MKKPDAAVHKFSNLLVCGGCVSIMSHIEYDGKSGYICESCGRKPKNEAKVQNKQFIHSQYVQDWLDHALRLILSGENFLNQVHGQSIKSLVHTNLTDIQASFYQIESHASELENPLIDLSFNAKVDFLRKQINYIQTKLRNLENEIEVTLNNPDREIALQEINSTNVDNFWFVPDIQINSLLHRLIGKRRLVVRNNLIVGTCEVER